MNLYHLRYFIQLAEMEHYTQAAEQLKITQPSLSHAISSLEDELGVKLFEKEGRNIRLTDTGAIFQLQIQEALSIIDDATDKMQQIQRGSGHIRIAMLRTLSQQIVPLLARSFIENSPDQQITIDFQTDTGLSRDIIDGLALKKFDIAFCSKMEASVDITYVPFAKQDLVLIVPEIHPLAAFDEVKLSETLAYPQIWFSHKSGIRPIVDQIFNSFSEQPEIAYEVEEDESIAGLVAAGFGIAVLPQLDLFDLLKVKTLKLTDLKMERLFYMAYLTNSYQTPVIKQFIEHVHTNNPLDSY